MHPARRALHQRVTSLSPAILGTCLVEEEMPTRCISCKASILPDSAPTCRRAPDRHLARNSFYQTRPGPQGYERKEVSEAQKCPEVST